MVLMVSFVATQGFCDEASKTVKTEKLLSLLKVDQQMAATNDRMKMTAKSQLTSSNLPPDLVQRMEAIFDKQFELIAQATNWDTIKGEFVGAYSTAFTEEEMDELIKFYESDLGKKLVDQLPELFAKGMEIGQAKLLEKQPEIQQTMMAEWEKFEASLTPEEKKYFQSDAVPVAPEAAMPADGAAVPAPEAAAPANGM